MPELKLMGTTICLPDEIILYAKLKHQYACLAQELSCEFKKNYEQNITNISLLEKNLEKIANSLFYKAIDYALKDLTTYGIYHINHESYSREVYEMGLMDTWNDMLSQIYKTLEEISNTKNSEMEYRRLRKESRDRFSGGGFGISGAIEGMATAGALNMASGLAHTAFNTVGNIGTEISASKQKNDLYKSISKVADHYFYITISNFYFATAIILAEEDVIRIRIPSDTDVNRQRGILENIFSKKISKEKAEELLVDCILLDPTNEKIYEYLITQYGDKDNSIEKFASVFYINLKNKKLSLFVDDLRQKRDKLIVDYSRKLDKVKLEENLIDIRNELNRNKKKYGINENIELEELINKDLQSLGSKNGIRVALSKIDYTNSETFESGVKVFENWALDSQVDIKDIEVAFEEVRIFYKNMDKKVDGEFYDSIEEAEAVSTLLKKLVSEIKNLSGNKRELILELITKFDKSDIKSKQKYMNYLNEQLIEEDIRFRTIRGVVYETREEAEQIRNENLAIENLLRTSVLDNRNKLVEIKNCIDTLSVLETQKDYLCYIETCFDIWDLMEEKSQTTVNNEFGTRKEYATYFYSLELIKLQAEYLGLVNAKFAKFYSMVEQDYFSVNGKLCTSSAEADKKYYKWVEHSRSYLKYITEKNATKKTFLSKIKTGITGVVYQGYEEEYNSLTKNGTLAIPNDSFSDLETIQLGIVKVNNNTYDEFKAKVKSYSELKKLSSSMLDKILNAEHLVENNTKDYSQEIYMIMKKVCPGIRINNIGGFIKNMYDDPIGTYLKITLTDVSSNKNDIFMTKEIISMYFEDLSEEEINALVNNVPILLTEKIDFGYGTDLTDALLSVNAKVSSELVDN